ncbi:MAG: acyltransferase [Roseburia sp.]|nr:acyltransferase [Roseburia sp.]
MRIFGKIGENKRFEAVDAVRFIMAIAVIAAHTNPVVNVENVMVLESVAFITELMNPFFFIASGFFLFYKMKKPYEENLEYMDKYLKKIIRLYVTWTFLSIPVHIYGYVLSGESLIHCIFSYIKYFLFVGKLYNSGHLWYLLALIYAVPAIRVLLKHKVKLPLIFVISFLIFTGNYIMCELAKKVEIMDNPAGRIVSIYTSVFNKGGVFTGFFYVSLGMLIAHGKRWLNVWIAIAGLAFFQIINIRFGLSYNAYLTAAEGVLLFMGILGTPSAKNKYGSIFRQMSELMYLSHLLFFSLYTIVIIKQPNKLGVDSFVFTVTLSGIFAIVFIKLRNRAGFRWIGKLV